MSAPQRERADERRHRVGHGVVLLGAALVALNIYDAATTLHIIDKLGGEELNPIMGGLLAVSPYAFLAYKTVVVLCCVIGILANWDLRLARWGMALLLAIYALLAVWNTLQMVP